MRCEYCNKKTYDVVTTNCYTVLCEDCADEYTSAYYDMETGEELVTVVN
tara:strand:+ start:218 stop:364 length:147 start_codon:yes stop_codon:yes gene_type:complete